MGEVAKLWGKKTAKYINKIRPTTLFKFTKGDENANDEYNKKNNEIMKAFGVKIIVTLLFNILAYSSQGLWEYLIKVFMK